MNALREAEIVRAYESNRRRRQDELHDRNWLREWDAIDAGRKVRR